MENKPNLTNHAQAESGRELAADLFATIHNELPPDAPMLIAKTGRIRLCNSRDNLWRGKAMINFETGELYDGSGRFWYCNSRLCPCCASRSARGHRKLVREALKLPLLVGQYRKFVTFTIPNHGRSLHESRRIVNYAWSLMRKRAWWKRTIKGGCKSEEFTLTRTGIHYHVHSILISKYILFEILRSEWTKAYMKAAERFGLPISVATADSLLIVNVRNISNRDQAANEVCKYITKSDSWKKLNPTDLLDVLRLKRFPRVFEMFGTWRNTATANASEPVALVDAERDGVTKTILDTDLLSDGSTFGDTHKIKTREDALAYFADLRSKIAECFRFREKQLKFKHPTATFFRKKTIDANAFAIIERQLYASTI